MHIKNFSSEIRTPLRPGHPFSRSAELPSHRAGKSVPQTQTSQTKKSEEKEWPLWKKTLALTAAAVAIGVLLKKGSDAYFWKPEAVGYQKEPGLCDPGHEKFIFSKKTGTCNPLDTKNCSFDPKNRIITYGTVYDNSKDPARNVYSCLTNHLDRLYANRWGLQHLVIDDAKKFTAQQCTDPLIHQKVDCELYWTKVYPFVQACDQFDVSPPTDGKEHWMIIKDDDMLALRHDIDPFHLIDSLRVGEDGVPNDASLILPTDSFPWVTNGYLDKTKRAVEPNFNPNTGFIAGRIDARSCPLYRKWWESRNSIPDRYDSKNCRTLGNCPGQDLALHEQQGIVVVADEHPCFKDLITVIKTRDVASKARQDIVINSVYGHDKYCYQKCDGNGCQDARLFAGFESDNPHAYQPGDAWVQPNAFPTLGKLSLRVGGKCSLTVGAEVEQVRLRLVREICEQSAQKAVCAQYLQGKSTKIVTVDLWAGLGNQMFQVAAAYAHALDIGGIALFPNNEVAHVGESPVLHNVMRTDIKLGKMANDWFRKIELPNDSLHLHGFFQSPQYFDHRRDEIVELFSPPSEINDFLTTQHKDLLNQDTVAIHVRRGDSLTYKNGGEAVMYNLSEDPDYYMQALKEFDTENQRFIIFSDDIEFAKNMPAFKNLKKITFINGQKPHEDFYLMSMCKNHIIANSTFSWWAAYLAKNPGKKVIMPKKWFGPGFPSEQWVRRDPTLAQIVEGSKEKCYLPPAYLPMADWVQV